MRTSLILRKIAWKPYREFVVWELGMVSTRFDLIVRACASKLDGFCLSLEHVRVNILLNVVLPWMC